MPLWDLGPIRTLLSGAVACLNDKPPCEFIEMATAPWQMVL